MELKQKYNKLKDIISNLGEVVVAFSGGVDSTFLTKVCQDILGDKVLAITVKAPIYSKQEIQEAKRLAQEIDVRHKIVVVEKEDIQEMTKNSLDRCYICKYKIFSNIKKQVVNKTIIDGSNIDDLDDFRPGMKALEELEVKSPLKEAGLTKDDIRKLSKELDLSTWNKPSFSCLATRVPYGEKITEEKISMIEEAENYLKDLGFKQFRVRHHGEIARIEVAPDERIKFFGLEIMDNITNKLKKIGFNYVALDLAGYRTGSMNEVLINERK